MSNVIRSHSLSIVEKKVIQTRKIEHVSMDTDEQELDPVQQKLQLLQEIDVLESRHSELQIELKTERELAQAEIAQWWEDKKEEAHIEAQRLAEEASAQGFQAGHEQGILQAEEEFRQQRHDMHELIEAAYEERAKIIQSSETFLLSLSVRVAEKVIKKELKQHDDQLLHVVQQALKNIEESEDVVMQVSLEDYPILLPFIEELKTYVRADSEFKLIPVANLSKGGCMIHTASGSYDATIDGQLEEIKKHLLAYGEEKTNDEPQNR